MKKILVYDRQQGYFELLKAHRKDDRVVLQENGNAYKGYEAIVFFMHDEIEMLELAKFMGDGAPLALVINRCNKSNSHTDGYANITCIDIDDTKDKLLEKLDAFIAGV